MAETEELLFANEAFYLAFSGNDLDAMKSIWSETGSPSCIHPGWGVITGYDEVIASWSAILGNTQPADISCLDAHGIIRGDVGTVTCFESLNGGYLIATNIFVREGERWRMVHHQAGPTSARPDAADKPDSANLH